MGAFLRPRSSRGDEKHVLKFGGFSGWGHQARQRGGRCYRRWDRMRAMVVYSIMQRGGFIPRDRMRAMVVYSIMQRGGFRPRGQTQVGKVVVYKVVVYGSDSRGGSCFNDMLYGREVVGNGGGAIGARRCYARTRTP